MTQKYKKSSIKINGRILEMSKVTFIRSLPPQSQSTVNTGNRSSCYTDAGTQQIFINNNHLLSFRLAIVP